MSRPFAGLWSRLFPTSTPVEPAPPDLQARLESTLQQLRAEAARFEHPMAQGASAQLSRLEGAWRAAREQARERLEAEILATHRLLGTGVERPELAAWRESLPALWPLPDGADCRMEVHVLDVLYRRVGGLAWERLNELMRAAGQEWPVAPELVHARQGEELAGVLEQHRREVHSAFLAQTPRAAVDLMLGEVGAWSHGYPEDGSWLWREAALRAVGAALRARLFIRAVELWHNRPPQVEAELQGVMQPHVEETQRLLAGGGLSPLQALQLLHQVEQACQEAVPLKVWCYLQGSLSEHGDPDCGCEREQG